MIARVVALGQRTAGDDGVGPAVLDRLRALAPPHVELLELADASALIPLIAAAVPLVIIDAVVMAGRSPGDLIELPADALPPRTRALSTHGVALPQAIAIGQALAPPGAVAATRLVGIVIAPPAPGAPGLSPEVAAAVTGAVGAVLSQIRALAGASSDLHGQRPAEAR